MSFLDKIFLTFFITHIPITILFDSQVLFPKSYYPSFATDLSASYAAQFKDPIMTIQPQSPWLLSFIVCEVLLQFPFFFFAVAGIYKNAKWINIPGIIYGIHVTTTVVPILAEILFTDYQAQGLVGPSTQQERLAVAGIYLPYLVIPLAFAIKLAVAPYGHNDGASQIAHKKK